MDNDKRKYFKEDNRNDENQEQTKVYKKAKKLKCMNFDERNYDYKELEHRLLGWIED